MKKLSLALVCLASLALAGCASVKPEEPLITATIPAPSSAVQAVVNQKMTTSGFQLVGANERLLTYRMPCTSVPGQNAFTCGLVMMNVGNSGWDGPYLYATVATFGVNKATSVSSQIQWCAINMAGKVNCMKAGNDVSNELTRGIAHQFGIQ